MSLRSMYDEDGGITSSHNSMTAYLESLANDPAASVYEPFTGGFLKGGQTSDENLDAYTVTLDTVEEVKAFVAIMKSKRATRSAAATALVPA